MKRAALWLVLSPLLACTNQHSVGSACQNGRCEALASDTGAACLVSSVTPALVRSTTNDASMCVLDPVAVFVTGMAGCSLYVTSTDPDFRCEGVGVRDASAEVPSMLAPVCELTQVQPPLAPAMTSEGRPSTWFIQDEPEGDGDCAGISSQRIGFNVALPADVFITLSCTVALAEPAEVGESGQQPIEIAPEICSGLGPLPERTPADIGTVCEPHVAPDAGYRLDRSYVDQRSAQCSSGVCLVDAAQALPLSPCLDSSECSADVDDLVYCSCRCDPKGDQSRARCACPGGFECRDILAPSAPSELAGGYCVRVASP